MTRARPKAPTTSSSTRPTSASSAGPWRSGPATSHPSCTGEIAILSATATATNQNAWIADFNKALTTDPKFAKLKLVDTVYGDDDATKSTNVANGLLQTHPNLKVIVAPTTVGILARPRS